MALLVLAIVLAGCIQHPPGGTTSPHSTSSTTSSTAPSATSSAMASTTSSSTLGMPGLPVTANGSAALEFVKGLALQSDGSPRFRIPGTPGQTEGARYLWQATNRPGWVREQENFTGQDYLGLDRSRVQSYGPGSAYCPKEWESKIPGLTFTNILVTKLARDPAAPVLVLGAHWDSQPESNMDPDPANRHLPDPGADDGASGVGVLLQLMRQLDGHDLPFTIRLFFTDGEDGFYACYPLAGTLYHVQRGDRNHVAGSSGKESAFILLDMVGDAGAIYPRESYSTQSAPGLVDLVWNHGQTKLGRHFSDTANTIEDDHVAYHDAHVRAIDVVDAGRPTVFPPQWDTTFDTVDRLDVGMLGAMVDLMQAVVTDPAMASFLSS